MVTQPVVVVVAQPVVVVDGAAVVVVDGAAVVVVDGAAVVVVVSSFVIVTVCTLVPSAPTPYCEVTLVKVTVKVSLLSTVSSPEITTDTFIELTPSAKLKVPLADV